VFALALSSSAQTLTITHATVIDTVSGALQPNRTVVIEGNRITSVRRSSRTEPAKGTVVDAHGQYLMPGLWDMHTHVFYGHTAKNATDLILPLFLANGITGIRDMGSALDPVLQARSGIAAHRLLGPRMVVAGPMLDGPKTRYEAGIPITTPEDGRKAVDMLKGHGVDFIKVQSGVPREAYFAIADQAKKDGIEFEGHVPDSIRASEAVASGQRTFEHLIGIFEASSTDETRFLTLHDKKVSMFLNTYSPALETSIIQLLAAKQVWQCPTLFWERGQWLVDGLDYSHDPDLPYATHTEVTTTWPAWRADMVQTIDTDPVAVRRTFVDHELEVVKKLHAANVPFLAGTDTPAGVDLIPGVSLHRELQRFVDAGFTPLQALQTATLNPAKFFGKLGDFGTVEPGRIADLVLLEANPLENIANTRSVIAVVNDGTYHSQKELDELRTKLAQLAATR
jgi:imidazolonepropionase-like amidohydrolase